MNNNGVLFCPGFRVYVVSPAVASSIKNFEAIACSKSVVYTRDHLYILPRYRLISSLTLNWYGRSHDTAKSVIIRNFSIIFQWYWPLEATKYCFQFRFTIHGQSFETKICLVTTRRRKIPSSNRLRRSNGWTNGRHFTFEDGQIVKVK